MIIAYKQAACSLVRSKATQGLYEVDRVLKGVAVQGLAGISCQCSTQSQAAGADLSLWEHADILTALTLIFEGNGA